MVLEIESYMQAMCKRAARVAGPSRRAGGRPRGATRAGDPQPPAGLQPPPSPTEARSGEREPHRVEPPRTATDTEPYQQAPWHNSRAKARPPAYVHPRNASRGPRTPSEDEQVLPREPCHPPPAIPRNFTPVLAARHTPPWLAGRRPTQLRPALLNRVGGGAGHHLAWPLQGPQRWVGAALAIAGGMRDPPKNCGTPRSTSSLPLPSSKCCPRQPRAVVQTVKAHPSHPCPRPPSAHDH
jgi:hypothetical protein